MKLTVEEFLARYTASGLGQRPARARGGPRVATEDRDQLLQEFAAAHQDRQPESAPELAQWLIRRGSLTRYQAKQLIAAKHPKLRVGGYLLRAPIQRPPFAGWWAAVDEAGRAARLYPAAPDDDETAHQRYQAHAAVTSPSLQAVDGPIEAERGRTYVSRLPAGTTAVEALAKGGFSASQVIRIGRQLTAAMAAVHDRGLQVPILDATRVWIAQTGDAILLRDPLADPLSGEGGWFTPPAVPGLYLAPERRLPGRAPDAASDLYSLGCLLFQLRFGQPPFTSAAESQLAIEHAQTLPEVLRKAVLDPAAGDPLLRVIAHAMAKNGDARFSRAGQLEAALIAIEPLAATADSSASASTSAAAPSSAVSAPAKPRPRRRKKNKAGPLVLGGLGFLVIVLLILLLVQRPGDRSGGNQLQPARPPLTPPSIAASKRAAVSATANPPADTSANDSPQLSKAAGVLWAPPSAGAAPELSLLPPGPDMIVSFRPSRLRTTEAGQQLAAVLAPELTEGLQHLESRIGVPLDQVQRLTMAIRGAGEGATQASLAVSLVEPLPIESLRDLWETEAAGAPSGRTVYVGADAEGDVYYTVPSEVKEISRFAVGSAEQIEQIAEIEGAPIPLPRSHEQVWRSLDADSDLVLLVSPNFLFADGRQLLEHYAPAMVGPLRRLLIPDATAVGLRMDLAPQWYAELRLAPGGSISPTALARRFDERIAGLPADAEEFLLASQPHPSWRALALRLPAMMRAVDSAARSGVVDGTAMVNLYLPPEAAPNVLLGAWLAVNTPAGRSDSTGVAESPSPENQPTTVGPKPIDEMLDRPLTVRFDQESLEFAAETIREQFNASLPPQSPQLKILLLGGDLRLAGITQNQQIRDFEHREAPLRRVLDDLVRRANPDKTATSLDHPAQKLVWALGPDPEDADSRVVLITTRDKAMADYELPPQFQSPQ